MRQWGPPFWLVASPVLALVLAWGLWSAYLSHEILLPLPRRGHWASLESEPFFFWSAVVLYAVLIPCCVLGAYSSLDDIKFARSMAKKRSDASKG